MVGLASQERNAAPVVVSPFPEGVSATWRLRACPTARRLSVVGRQRDLAEPPPDEPGL